MVCMWCVVFWSGNARLSDQTEFVFLRNYKFWFYSCNCSGCWNESQFWWHWTLRSSSALWETGCHTLSLPSNRQKTLKICSWLRAKQYTITKAAGASLKVAEFRSVTSSMACAQNQLCLYALLRITCIHHSVLTVSLSRQEMSWPILWS